MKPLRVLYLRLEWKGSVLGVGLLLSRPGLRLEPQAALAVINPLTRLRLEKLENCRIWRINYVFVFVFVFKEKEV